jgi:glycosyltransferase involved in cell wall biosynthesis
VWIVPNGVDFTRFVPMERVACQRRLEWSTERSHVLFPAPRSRGEKRYELAAQAVGLLEREGHEVELHALEGVSHDQVPIWLNAAHAVVLTSRREGSPNVVKEALACNVPVVSVDVGDVRERLAGIAGCFVTEPTPQDLAQKLARVLPGRTSVDGRTAIADLSLERVAEKLREIYGILTRER